MEQLKVIINFVKNYFFIIFLIFICLIFSLKISATASKISYDYHYSLLADSFLHGRLDLNPQSSHFPPGDVAWYNGKYYVVWGPLPGILLVPGVLIFGDGFPQNSVTLLAAALIFFLVFSLGRKFQFSSYSSLWLAIFFVFGTVLSFNTLVNISAFQYPIIGLLFVLLAVNELYHHQRYFLIGTYLGLAFVTRNTLVVSLIYFLLVIFQESSSKTQKLSSLFKLLLPILLVGFSLGCYNFSRFGHWLETGYLYNVTLPVQPTFSVAMKYGLFSLHHLSTNLYYFLIKGPELSTSFPFLKADAWGLSLIFTSPLFLIPLFSPKIRRNLKEWLTILALAFPSLTFYSVGFAQFGYRYAVDFYPFLLLLLFKFLHGQLDYKYKVLIVYSVFFNFLFMLSIWGKYPLLGL